MLFVKLEPGDETVHTNFTGNRSAANVLPLSVILRSEILKQTNKQNLE